MKRGHGSARQRGAWALPVYGPAGSSVKSMGGKRGGKVIKSSIVILRQKIACKLITVLGKERQNNRRRDRQKKEKNERDKHCLEHDWV